jgi:hypothetical protein
VRQMVAERMADGLNDNGGWGGVCEQGLTRVRSKALTKS